MGQESKRDISRVHIRPLRGDHVRGGFCCTVQKIENYCKNNIRRQHDAYQVRAYVACEAESLDVLGFYYLCLSSLKCGKLDDASDGKFERVDAVPVVYLGMIAVHREWARSGIGKMLMAHALKITSEIAERAGTYALTLDALDKDLVEYYKGFGFQPFKNGETGLEMFLPIGTIMQAVAQAEVQT